MLEGDYDARSEGNRSVIFDKMEERCKSDPDTSSLEQLEKIQKVFESLSKEEGVLLCAR